MAWPRPTPADRRLLRRLQAVAGAGAAALLVAGILWVEWQYRRDPLPLIDRPLAVVAVARDSAFAVCTPGDEERVYHDLRLVTGAGGGGAGAGNLRLALSLPAGAGPGDRLPVVLILGGLEIGRESLKYVPHHGRNALVACEYPYSPVYWYEGTPLGQLPAIRRAVLAVPAQAAAMARWAAAQPWADPERVSVLGYSFGALFVPAVYRVAPRQGMRLGPGVVAYGGAGLWQLLEASLRLRPRWWRNAVAWLAGSVVAPIEPARHIPFVTQELLFLNGLEDHQIPRTCALRLRDLKPGPKTAIDLEAGHMSPRRPELTARIAAVSTGWLLARGAIEE